MLIARLFAISIVLFSSACTIFQDPEIVLVRAPFKDPRPIADIDNGKISPHLKGVWQYSLLSAAAYMFNSVKGKDVLTINKVCQMHSKYYARWERIKGYSVKEFFPDVESNRLLITGLEYSVWQDTSQQNPKRLALVFRGSDWELGDVYSNLRWITKLNPFTWDQYDQTRDLVEKLVPALKIKYGRDVEIVATGHSLGGGLATHAAYSSPDIDVVYAFATSPVTGSSSLDPRIDGKGVEIFRIHEAGEILSVFRWVGRLFDRLDKKDPKIEEARFNFRTTFKIGSVGGGPIKQHGIDQLSCDLICRIEKSGNTQQCLRQAKVN